MIKILKTKIKNRLISEYNSIFSKGAVDVDERELKEVIERILGEIIYKEHFELSGADEEKIVDELIDEFIGLGPIENLIKDSSITEIMINGVGKIFIERNGKKELTDIIFDDDKQLMHLIHKMLLPTRRRLDESYPYTEVSLKDGSRVNIIIPPLALNGPTVTIRKFLKEIASIEDLIVLGTLNKRISGFLIAAVKSKVNIIFSGATGAGKTTTLNIFSPYIDNEERVVSIEDTAELHLIQDNVVRLEARQPNIEGKGEVTIRNLFKNSLRMRPDRIILGEIRGGEALDMLQAICSGHTGSLSVIHANSPQEVIYRLETMILTSGVPITLESIHRQIAASVHLIVQQEQLLDGTRKITHITQINGLKGNLVNLEDIFVYEMEGIGHEGRILGKWRTTGIVPSFMDLFKKSAVDLPEDIFNKD